MRKTSLSESVLEGIRLGDEVISPQEFIRRRQVDPQSMRGATFVLPSRKGPFGSFLVKRSTPHYEVLGARRSKR